MAKAGFPETRWSLIIAAAGNQTAGADEALAHLCQAYWYPLYAYVRLRGYPVDAARDLTQEFFAYLLEKRLMAGADREKGRFRSFLLTALKRFLGDQADHSHAMKRGGHLAILSLETEAAERKLATVVHNGDTPDRLFEREWAQTLITRVTGELRTAMEREGRAHQFEQLKRYLPGQEPDDAGTDTPPNPGAKEGALKVAVHRLRRRYRDLFHAEMAQLVDDPAQIEDEIRYVLNALRN